MRLRIGWLMLLAVALAARAGVAADKPTVALVPAHVFKGSADNGPAVTAAFRANLEREGYRVIPAAETEAAMKTLNIDVSKPQFVPSMTALGKELKARYVVYPRVPGVGIGVNQQDPEEFQATILLNVIDPEKKEIIYLRQIGQLFKHPDQMLERAVIPKKEAEDAAQKLIEGFYKKVGG